MILVTAETIVSPPDIFFFRGKVKKVAGARVCGSKRRSAAGMCRRHHSVAIM